MAQRRGFQNMYDGYEAPSFADDDDGGFGGLAALLGDIPVGDGSFASPDPWMPPPGWEPPTRPGSLDPDLDAGLRAALQTDPGGGGIGGNTDSARELSRAPRPSQYTGGQQPAMSGLPEGVTVPETQFSGVPASSNTMQTPLSPTSPSPVSMQRQSASAAPNESGGTGPQRPSFTPSQSALFGDAPGRSGLFGGLGGLTEGGIGVMGGGGGGPKPTEMMLALARMLRQPGV